MEYGKWTTFLTCEFILLAASNFGGNNEVLSRYSKS